MRYTNLGNISNVLEVFRYQAENNSVYKEYLERLKIKPFTVSKLTQLPFLPVEFFKTHQVITGKNPVKTVFVSSGTSGVTNSKHYVTDLNLYEKSVREGFEMFYGQPQEYIFLALLPSYLERTDSSLVYMVDQLMKASGQAGSGFFLDTLEELINTILELEQKKQKYILLGVTYALLDLGEIYHQRKLPPIKHGIIMETGGMKGKRKELLKTEVHQILKQSFAVSAIHSEYGMTELLSQAYSKGDGLFSCPPWMKVLIRDPNDPFQLFDHNKTGCINIIDLSNLNSCSFISTMDLGKLHGENTFEVLGRFDNSDLRGCNLMVS